MGKRRDPADRNYAAFFALIKQMKGAEKEQLVFQFTSGRTESLKEMTDTEYSRMLGAMRRGLHQGEELRLAKSRALHQLQLYGVNTTDWGEINRFVSQPRIAGKIVWDMTVAELDALTRKMRAINKKVRRARKEQDIAEANQEILRIQAGRSLPS